jgi:ABC-type uncharacterized transport system permease subunit
MNLLSSINLLLAHIYYGMSWLNHGLLIRFKKFAPKVLKIVQLVIFHLHLILHTCVKHLMWGKFWDVKSAYRYKLHHQQITSYTWTWVCKMMQRCQPEWWSRPDFFKKRCADGNLQWRLLRPCYVLWIWMWLPLWACLADLGTSYLGLFPLTQHY